MKSLSLKLDDHVFEETESLLQRLKESRNRYINKALEHFNKIQRRKLVGEQIAAESLIVREDSLESAVNLNNWTMKLQKFEIWLADLEPAIGTEPGKTRPVLVVQGDYLNRNHRSTIVCPITTKVRAGVSALRVHLEAGEGGLAKESDIVIDQIRAIDNKRFIKKLGTLPFSKEQTVHQNIADILEL